MRHAVVAEVPQHGYADLAARAEVLPAAAAELGPFAIQRPAARTLELVGSRRDLQRTARVAQVLAADLALLLAGGVEGLAEAALDDLPELGQRLGVLALRHLREVRHQLRHVLVALLGR